jgi:hypothetical protein
MRFFHVPGAGVLMTISVFGLVLIYSILGFYFLNTGTLRDQNLALTIFCGLTLPVGLIGILFRLQFWAGSGVMLFTGMLVTGIAVFAALIMSIISPKTQLKSYYRNMLIRSTIVFVLVLSLHLISLSTLVRILHRDDPKTAELLIYHLEHPEDDKAYEDYLRHTRP